MRFRDKPAIDDPNELGFGRALHPVATSRGMVIGGGTVYPELNFTLPVMAIDRTTLPEIRDQYRRIIVEAVGRAAALDAPGLVVEFETLPPMTVHPEWGSQIVQILLDEMEEAYAREGLKSVLRMTPNDVREFVRPPKMRSGVYWESMLASFEQSAALGAELLSIESVGGKELHDEAVTLCDLPQVIFSLCVLGVRDMKFLWTALQEVADRYGVRCAGDTACGFANTAMVLAEQKMIPRVFAAVVRAVSAVRSLVAYECGAVGPGKDCGYENVILKAITGMPMAMEGKTATCAHLSPLGNIAAAACDVWSNESVQNIKLLGGMAPICFLESLIYDCRLMNEAIADGRDAARMLRDWLVRSDARLDPQAYLLTPENAVRLARVIVQAGGYYEAGKAAARCAIELLVDAMREGRVRIIERERPWLDRMRRSLDSLPDDEDRFIARQMAVSDRTKFLPAEYGIDPD